MKFLSLRLSIFSIFFTVFSSLFAQIGPHQANLEWQQIDTEKVRVIFPKGFEKEGLRVVNLVDLMEKNHKRSIGPLSEKLELVLHNRTVIPNGFVGIAPFRSEFFATPPQSANLLGTADWLDALTIHEYRHALQFSNAKVGITKLFYFLQGENGWGLVSGASIPNWFWEGDATIMETALSNGGRGRAPFFTLEQRAILKSGRLYSYAKVRNRSLKDLIPDHYRLGYTMIMDIRAQYGNDTWQSIFEEAARYRSLFYPFSNALKRKTGFSTEALYIHSYQKLAQKWQRQIEQLKLSPTKLVATKPKKTVTNYRYPYFLKDGSIICLKSSFQKTDALIHIINGKEKVLTNIGFHIEKYLSLTGNIAVWTEFEQNPRRSNQNYSNIILYNLKTKTKTRFTKKGRYFSPDFSHSAGRLVTVQITPEQENSILILNATTGATTRILPNPDNHFLAFPKWAENDTDIVYLAKHQGQLAIFKYNLIENSTLQLTDWTHHTIADLFVKNRKVYFTSSISGIDNIYDVSLNGDRKIRQLTSVSIGAFFPSLAADNETLLFSEFTSMGYELSTLPLYSTAKRPVNIIEPTEQTQYLINSISEEGGNILNNVPEKDYPIQPYKGLFKSMKLHSWNFTPSVSLPTLDIQIDNVLEDFSVNLIGGYNFNENSPVYVAAASYGKWYPLLTTFVSATNRGAVYLTPQDSLAIQEFDQTSVGGRVALPLNWLKGNYSTGLNVFAGYTQRFVRNGEFDEIAIENFSLGNIQLGFSVANLRRRALQNLAARWGQTFSLSFEQTTNAASNKKINVAGNLFFPGIGPNHSLKLSFAFQRELLENQYQFADGFEYPRGFDAILNDEFLRLSADYQLPLLYPDLGFAGIIYFRRISLNAFFDYGRRSILLVDFNDNHNSVGAELIFDTNFWHELPVTFGLRNAYLLTEDSDKYQFEFFVRSFLIE